MAEEPVYSRLAQAMQALARQGVELSTEGVPYGQGRVGAGLTRPIAPGVNAFVRGSTVPFQGAPRGAWDSRIMGGVQWTMPP